MKEKIGNVELDYEFYKGNDQYSDGDIENDLLEYVKNSDNLLDILNKEDRWPILYHLSALRQNILQWYSFKKDCTVLEIGSGCGAITGVLCENAKRVICNDLSKKRSMINAYRNKKYTNLQIKVGNFNDVVFHEKFDYITLIGVLEYAAYYTASDHPFEDFLMTIKKHLKKDGKLLIAIENKFGLKYWAGCQEDHTGIYFDGLEGYQNTKSKVRTFSKNALEKILIHAGFKQNNFYYPFPDYKFPNEIYSEDYMPGIADLTCSRESYSGERLLLFDETAVLSQIIEDDMFPFFANSFFVEANVEGE